MFITELTDDFLVLDYPVEYMAMLLGFDTLTIVLGLVVLSSLAIFKLLDIILSH